MDIQGHKFNINNIPAVIYGEKTDKCFLFIHGKNGNKEEAKDFFETISEKGWQVLGIDLPSHGERIGEKDNFDPWHVVPELKEVYSYMKNEWQIISLCANSIGAWFAMLAFSGDEFAESLFISPIVNMQNLIIKMMGWAKVTISELEMKKTIETDFGETLSLKYYQFAVDNPIILWKSNTYIIYGDKDDMTSYEEINSFTKRIAAALTVIENGEHYFHTIGQLTILKRWIKDRINNRPESLPGVTKKSFSLFYNGGEIWCEHLDGIFQYTDIAIRKLNQDCEEFMRPSKPGFMAINLDETVIGDRLIDEIIEKLSDNRKVFRKIAFVGVDKHSKKKFSKAFDKAEFDIAFIDDYEKAKAWLI